VPSSTSSSDDRLPSLPWVGLLVPACLFFLVVVVALETRLASLGIKPTIQDSEALWIKERGLADDIGPNAIVLTGASRIHLGIDLPTLQVITGLKPVQLAIVGTSSLSVLKGLADDPDFKGTVLVDYYARMLSNPTDDIAALYEYHFEQRNRHGLESTEAEEWLTDNLRSQLRSYADDSRPFNSLVQRALIGHPLPQYVSMYADRSRAANYSLVKMPDFYYARVIRNLGISGDGESLPGDMKQADAKREIEKRIASIQPADTVSFGKGVQLLKALSEKIHRRGGNVVVVRMPTSGYVEEEEELRFPRKMFWDRLVADVGTPAINYADYPGTKVFTCPDGSHLDQADRAPFTNALARILMQTLSSEKLAY